MSGSTRNSPSAGDGVRSCLPATAEHGWEPWAFLGGFRVPVRASSSRIARHRCRFHFLEHLAHGSLSRFQCLGARKGFPQAVQAIGCEA